MLDLLKSLKKIIARRVVNIQPLRSNISAGDTTVYVRSAKRCVPGDKIVIYREGEADGEINTIGEIPDYMTLTLCNPVEENYSTSNTRIQNLIGGQTFIKGIYIGDPPVIPQYPAITIYGRSRSDEWLTLDSTRERFEIDISVYIESEFYDQGYEMVLNLTKRIETALFASFYPLVQPYHLTTLTEDVTETDTIIRVANDDNCYNFAWFWLENYDHTTPTKPKCYLGNGVIELTASLGHSFEAGDEVIFPGRHFYDTRAESTEYGSVTKNSLLWGSRISYFAVEEVLRSNPFLDPLNLR